MAKIVYFTLALVWISIVMCCTSGLPTSDEERYYDKELSRELLNWLNSVHYSQAVQNPCRYYPGNAINTPMAKRNSELINSLLSLPKNMNDAGK